MGEAYFRAHFARKIKSLRENAGLSQGELGDILGCSRGSISFYEQMQRVPDIEILKNICRYFDVSADYLLGLSEVKSVDTDVQAICEYTGLSEEAVEWLHDPGPITPLHPVVNTLLSSELIRCTEGMYNCFLKSKRCYEIYSKAEADVHEGGGDLPDITAHENGTVTLNAEMGHLLCLDAAAKYAKYIMEVVITEGKFGG